MLNDGLEICIKTAKILKEQFPNEVMKIEKNTIIEHSVKNSRLIKRSDGMSNLYAYYTKYTPHRIVVKQKVLNEQKCLRTKIKNQADRKMLYGNFALVELMCHELAHHRTKGHAKGFKVKYHRFLDFMTNKIISGDFYDV